MRRRRRLVAEVREDAEEDSIASIAAELADVRGARAFTVGGRCDRLSTSLGLQGESRLIASDPVGWQLLAGAIKGQLDDEAITELKIAWQSPVTMELLEAEGRPLVMRSLWMVTEASRALPGESQLTELAATAMKQARPFIEKTLATSETTAVGNTPADSTAIQGLLFAALALPAGDELRFDCTSRLMVLWKDQQAFQTIRLVAEPLLKPAEGLDAAQLVAALNTEADENLLVLAALACRDAGPEAWGIYRRASRDVLRQTPVPGSVVVLINNMRSSL